MQQQRNKARTPETATRCQLWRQMKLPAVMMQGGGEGLGGEGGGKVGEEKVGGGGGEEPVKAAIALVRNAFRAQPQTPSGKAPE